MTLWLVFLLSNFIVADCNEKEAWVDPHDMGISSFHTEEKQSVTNTTDTPEFLCLQRHSIRLLRALKISGETEGVDATLQVRLDAYDVASIQAFSSLEKNASTASKIKSLHNLEMVLEHMLEDVTFEEQHVLMEDSFLYEVVSSWLNALFIIIPVIVTVLLVLSLWGGVPVWKVVCLLFIISCGWEWIHLYKRKLAEKREVLFKSEAGGHCFNSNGLLWSFPAHMLKKLFDFKVDECAKYHEALEVDAYLEVTPATAVAETITKLLLHPLDHLGDKLGSFFGRIISANTYVGAIGALVLSFLLIALLMIMIGGYSIRLPYFLGSFEPVRSPAKQGISEDRLEKLLLEMKEALAMLQPPAIVNHNEATALPTEPPPSTPKIETIPS